MGFVEGSEGLEGFEGFEGANTGSYGLAVCDLLGSVCRGKANDQYNGPNKGR